MNRVARLLQDDDEAEVPAASLIGAVALACRVQLEDPHDQRHSNRQEKSQEQKKMERRENSPVQDGGQSMEYLPTSDTNTLLRDGWKADLLAVLYVHPGDLQRWNGRKKSIQGLQELPARSRGRYQELTCTGR